MHSFRRSSELEKEIMDTYDHYMKLGGSIENVIDAIPRLIQSNKRREEYRKLTGEGNKVNISYKKFLGIPYGIKKISVNGRLQIGTPFESLTTRKSIAEELGRQRATIDLLKQFTEKYIAHGGLKDSTALIPTCNEKTLSAVKSSLEHNDLATFFEILQSVLSSLPYDMKITESYFHSHIHLILKILDFKILSEQETNIGRIDSVVETEKYLFIMEFKISNATIALQQILEKKYYQPFLTTKKRIMLVGVALDTNSRNITGWDIQSYPSTAAPGH
jgi:hypothetical protein